MVVAAVFIVLALVLFACSYMSKRRFGLLGLALTAGATISTIWSHDAGLVLSGLGLLPQGPLANAITLSVVVLLPAILLLFHGYTYKKPVGRVVGSLLFTVLALAFLVEPIGYALVLEGLGADIYKVLVDNKELIISIGVVLAIFDLFLTKPAVLAENSKKKK